MENNSIIYFAFNKVSLKQKYAVGFQQKGQEELYCRL
jgi:hypothetical protein